MNELHTSRFCELGIERQHLDGEGYFVDDALAWRLMSSPQFEVFRRIIGAISIAVVNLFCAKKWSTEYLPHYFSVLVQFDSATAMQSSVSSRYQIAGFGNWAPFPTAVAAFSRTKTLSVIVTGVAAVFCSAKTALCGFTTKFALEHRWRALDHERWFSTQVKLVKEYV